MVCTTCLEPIDAEAKLDSLHSHQDTGKSFLPFPTTPQIYRHQTEKTVIVLHLVNITKGLSQSDINMACPSVCIQNITNV